MDVTEVAEANLARLRRVLNSDGGLAMQAAATLRAERLYAIPRSVPHWWQDRVHVPTGWIIWAGLAWTVSYESWSVHNSGSDSSDCWWYIWTMWQFIRIFMATVMHCGWRSFSILIILSRIWVDKGDEVVWGDIQPEVIKRCWRLCMKICGPAGQIDPEFGVRMPIR